MVLGTLQTSRVMNKESEKSCHKRNHGASCNGSNGKHEDLGTNGTSGSCSYDESAGEEDTLTMHADADGDTPSDVDVSRKKKQREMTFQGMYNVFDFDDDEDDSDWEPVQKRLEIVKWFCTNCTMVNLDDVVHCDICGEHKESGILKYGFFASPILEDTGLIEIETETKGRDKDGCSQQSSSSSNGCTAIGFDERMLLHSEVEMKSHPHPERPDRLRAIAASLATAGIFPGRCYPISAREITQQELQMVHSLEHIQAVEFTSHIFSSYFTPDTYANEHSAHAARLAAGLCADIASAIVSARVKNGFALVRPPGHHAGIRQAMGFCLHNNAAVAALAAQVAGAKKVLIVDWDVHHGNGTQEIFEQNKSVLYISLHRHEGGKFYPGTGAADEVGSKGAEGYCVNVPWGRGGVGDSDYIFAFQHVVLPIAAEFAPDFTIISAGFDAARGDPLGCCDVTPAGYAQMTDMLYNLCGGKLLVILEGGYNLRSISSSATAVIKVLLGEEGTTCELGNIVPSKAGLQTVLEVLKIQMNFWPSLGSIFEKLQLQWVPSCLQSKKEQVKKRRRIDAPVWWKWGRKSLLYHFLSRHHHERRKGH
ncbi:histone deacetylase 15 isoform X1 [Ricinus communis]|uniref:histone deacetylase 15 isoform X1 n=1 Tax=Ricinus communis TaxID=3988 RepID=UPI00077261B2|nr:histone deacetylase 15 isoform X1 [Ricinus communis]XP_015584443.1 histone deacetylase 15 isoform X1 [Ricinus communis]|eukprot:XP_015584442.1 histone deacetylase 15 [Ricinus communis]